MFVYGVKNYLLTTIEKVYCACSPNVIVGREMSEKFPNENTGEFSIQKSQ